jgi:hypothetical protein
VTSIVRTAAGHSGARQPVIARIGPVVFERLGRWVTVRCPPEFSSVMRRAGGTWEPGETHWLIHVRRIGPVIRVLRSETAALGTGGGLDEPEKEGAAPRAAPQVASFCG